MSCYFYALVVAWGQKQYCNFGDLMSKNINTDTDKIYFRSDDELGAMDAANDSFLDQCFIDTGIANIISDCKNPKSILLGRTGAGKSALLMNLENMHDHVIRIKPIDVSMNYISSCNVINNFVNLGINLGPVFKTLWRHVITLELIKKVYNLNDAQDKSIFYRIMSTFDKQMRTPHYKECNAYFQEWNDSFWDDTEKGTTKFTNKIEASLASEVMTRVPIISSKLESGATISNEEIKELRVIGQRFVQNDQIKSLNRIFDFLDKHVLTNDQKSYYVIVDDLDTSWVENNLKYRIIRALIDIINDFRGIRNAKVIIALRVDLLDHVMKITRQHGDQEEKVHDICANLIWTRKDLINMIDKRISFLFKNRYTKRSVTHQDILPKPGDPVN